MRPAYLVGRVGNDGPYNNNVYYKKSEAVTEAKRMAREMPDSSFVVLKTVPILKFKSLGVVVEELDVAKQEN
jgi:hypothetical protein